MGVDHSELKSNVETFVRRACSRTGPVERFDAFHSASGVDGRLGSVPVGEGDEPSLIAEDLVELIASDALTHEGRQRYVIRCFRKGKTDHDEQRSITVDGSGSNDGLSHPATSEGQFTSMMRYLHITERLLFEVLQKYRTDVREEVAAKDRRIEKLEEKYGETLQLAADLFDRKAEREIELVNKRREAKFEAMTMRQVELMMTAMQAQAMGDKAPLAMRKAPLGKGALRELFRTLSDDQREHLLPLMTPAQVATWQIFAAAYAKGEEAVQGDALMRSLVQTITPDQIGRWLEVLRPEQQDMLRGVIGEYVIESELEDADVREGLNGTASLAGGP